MEELINSEVIQNQALTNNFHHLIFKSQSLNSFKSGQFVVLKISENVFRAYSIASTPDKLPYWEIVVDTTPGGPGSTFLKNLKIKEVIQTSQPRGSLFFQDDGSNNIICLATGCGIASMKPIAESALKSKAKTVHFLWGLRFENDIFFQDQLSELAKKNKGFKYDITLSKPSENYTGKKGRITQYLSEIINKKNLNTTSIYLCGNNEMIEDVTNYLKQVDFPQNKVYFEKYY